jgi:hypothetical protein
MHNDWIDRADPERCYCTGGFCSTQHRECHDDLECKKLPKCANKNCVCTFGGFSRSAPPPLKEVVAQPHFSQYGHLFSISLTLLDY